ncbi:superoxide dismutase [Gorgonomyces haynaldii]|nr:superoxide dismutase [Gorgonomyces haynaldii]
MFFLAAIVSAEYSKCTKIAKADLLPDLVNPNGTLVKGSFVIEQAQEEEAELTLKIAGLPANTKHGWHIHALPISDQNCTSAGAHYNPLNVTHGDRLAAVRHVGDLGNFVTNEKGEAEIELTDKIVSLFGEFAVYNKTLVIHNNEDDLGLTNATTSKTVGNSGSRLSCGVIKLVDAIACDKPVTVPTKSEETKSAEPEKTGAYDIPKPETTSEPTSEPKDTSKDNYYVSGASAIAPLALFALSLL